VPWARIILVTVFWDKEAVIVVNVLARGTTVNCFCYNETVGSLNACLCPLTSSHKKNVVTFAPSWHARPHTSEVIT
jgi:hypothetical protein